MMTHVEINDAALAGHVKSIADLVSQDVYTALLKYVPDMLRKAPVNITLIDPVNEHGAQQVEETINKRELHALYALMNYTAWLHNLQPETVRAWLEDQFDVQHVALIPRASFQRAVGYLMEMDFYCEEARG
jgi:hypothetical protein